jgi:hypothetical protein
LFAQLCSSVPTIVHDQYSVRVAAETLVQ